MFFFLKSNTQKRNEELPITSPLFLSTCYKTETLPRKLFFTNQVSCLRRTTMSPLGCILPDFLLACLWNHKVYQLFFSLVWNICYPSTLFFYKGICSEMRFVDHFKCLNSAPRDKCMPTPQLTSVFLKRETLFNTFSLFYSLEKTETHRSFL